MPRYVEGLRERNRRSVYRCLLERDGEQLSRNDLCRATGLSHPTVRTILQEFGELGLCQEVGHSTARGGRPAQLVAFRPDAVSVLSVDLSERTYRAALIDLTGRVLERSEGPPRRAGASEELFGWLEGTLQQWERDRVIGRLAVALPGVVVQESGSVHYAPALGWHDYPLATVLRERLGIEVTLENDVNALARAELYFGFSSPWTNALFLTLTSGVGMGIAIGGRIYRGSHSAAGEIGYGAIGSVSAAPDPSLDAPGRLEAHLQKLMETFMPTGVLDLGTEPAREAFERFVTDLAIVVQNAVCLLDPEYLVVSWPADPQQLLVSALREELSAPVPLEVVPVALGRDATLLGVAHMALTELEDQFCVLDLP